jgi:hypothetical protein
MAHRSGRFRAASGAYTGGKTPSAARQPGRRSHEPGLPFAAPNHGPSGALSEPRAERAAGPRAVTPARGSWPGQNRRRGKTPSEPRAERAAGPRERAVTPARGPEPFSHRAFGAASGAAEGPRERAVARVTGPGRTGDAAKPRQPARQPLTPAGVLTNAGLPFAAPNQWRTVRGAFRAASGAAEGRGSERLHRPAARDRQSVAPTAAPPAWCRSNRSRFITLVHALMKSRTNFSPASAAA